MLENIFIELTKYKKDFLCSKTGNDFENRIKSCLKQFHYTEVYINQFDKKEYSQMKKQIIDKISDKKINNPFNQPQFKNCFIYQPYGSQEFPDFLVFTDNYIIPLEIKYTQKSCKAPMWNGNLPKMNAIYIFGSYGKQDITYFLGNDILEHKERIKLVKFFEDIRKIENEFKEEIKSLYKTKELNQDKGFMVYIREAYSQSKKINKNAETDYFKFVNRDALEINVIEYCRKVK